VAASGVIARLLEVASAQPEALAIDGPSKLTYRELIDAVRPLAAGLRPELIGVCLERSPDLVIAELATWFAGGAFVPLDPSLPERRLEWMARDAGISRVITRTDLAARFERLGIETVAGPLRLSPVPAPHDPTRLAYVIYTSGSTGHPKGVRVLQRGLTALFDAQIEAFRLAPGKRALFFLSIGFDASISDLGTALLSGATLVIPPDSTRAGPDLLSELARQRITHADLPPSLLAELDPKLAPPDLETVVIGGEVCPPHVVRSWAERVRLVNVYGPTEATVCTSLSVCDPRWDRPRIGRPLPGVRYRVAGERLEPLGPGSPGELWIGGDCLAEGYHGRPDLTAERFVHLDGERWYRSGDRVVADAEGEFEFLGRIDRQIKLRGRRIEPQEIEACLEAHPGVLRAAVIKEQRESLGEELVAYFTARADRVVDVEALRAHLGAQLPRWMVPRLVHAPALPKTASGKVDRGALAALESGGPKLGPGELPSTPLETGLVEIWEELFSRSPIGVNQSFFDLGGDSLVAIKLAARAAARGLEIAPDAIYHHPTIRALASSGGIDSGLDRGLLEVKAVLEPGLVEALALRRELPARRSARRILLTGASGWLGARLLLELLRESDARIACLIRARDEQHARERLAEAIARHGATFPDPARLELIPADLERPRFGLAPSRWSDLGEVDAIVHSASVVNLLRPYSELEAPNVLAFQRLLELAATGAPKQLHLVSSLSVFVGSDRNTGILRERDRLDTTRRIYGGYAQSKWVAERMAERAVDAGLRQVWVYRLGLITRDSATGLRGPRDFLALFLDGLARLGAVPAVDPELAVDMTPVDFAARALFRIALGAPPGCYHLAAERGLPIGELLEAVRRSKAPLRTVSAHEWLELRSRVTDPRALLAYLALCRASEAFGTQRSLDLFQATRVVFDRTEADRALADSGIRCPLPRCDDLSSYLGPAVARDVREI
jgi:nonribosomal peptide synthetase MxcG